MTSVFWLLFGFSYSSDVDGQNYVILFALEINIFFLFEYRLNISSLNIFLTNVRWLYETILRCFQSDLWTSNPAIAIASFTKSSIITMQTTKGSSIKKPVKWIQINRSQGTNVRLDPLNVIFCIPNRPLRRFHSKKRDVFKGLSSFSL